MPKKKTVFSGCATAIITPFKNGKVDYKSLENIIEYQIKGKADAIVVCGTTGESATLSEKERRKIISFSVKKADGRIPVIAGTGCNNIKSAVALSRYASENGADAVMTVTPYYNKASLTGLVNSFTAIADNVDVPVILYNVPSRTGIDIPLEAYKILSEHDNIVGVKEASGNIVTSERILNACQGKLEVYSGNDDMILPIMSIGGSGAVSVVSNIVPNIVHDICKLAIKSEIYQSRRLQLGYLPLIEALFSEINPIPVKTAMSLMGLCTDEMRLPMCPLDENKKAKLISVLSEYDLIN